MKRSKLRNDFLKDRNNASQTAYKKTMQLLCNPFEKSQKTVFPKFKTKAYT